MPRQRPFDPAVEEDDTIAGAYDSLAGMGFEVVQPPAKYQPIGRMFQPKAPAPRKRMRRGRFVPVAAYEALRSMAQQAVWIERGGRAIREASEYQTGGDVIGRTSWIGMPEWARGFGYDRAAIVAAVEKAIAGEWLGDKQEILIRAMLDEIAGPRNQQPEPAPWLDEIGANVGHSDECPF